MALRYLIDSGSFLEGDFIWTTLDNREIKLAQFSEVQSDIPHSYTEQFQFFYGDQVHGIFKTRLPQVLIPLQRDRCLAELNQVGMLLLLFEVMGYNARLEQQVKELSQINEHKREILLQVSHDLRGPLTNIKMAAKVLREEIYGTLTPKQAAYINVIEEADDLVLALSNNLLTQATLQAERLELDIATVRVRDLCEFCLSLCQPLAERKGLSLSLHITRPIQYIAADELRFKQMLINLIGNAIKFTETGSVRLSVRCVKPKGARTLQSGNLQFIVEDTGVGISPPDQATLFTAFTQLSATKGVHNGTGLGLFITDSLARLHGGSIKVESQLGKGSRFILEFPERLIMTRVQWPRVVKLEPR